MISYFEVHLVRCSVFSPEAPSALGAGNGTGMAWMSVMTSWMLPVPLTTSAAVMVVRHASSEKAGWWNRESGLWNTRDHPVVLHRTCTRQCWSIGAGGGDPRLGTAEAQ